MQLKAPSTPVGRRAQRAGSVTSPRASSTSSGSASRGAGEVADQGDDLVAALGQRERDGVADLARCACDQEPHRPILEADPIVSLPCPASRSHQDPLFARINASIGFDRRLWPQDIRGSKAHAAALARAGVITAEELERIRGGLDAVAGELERASSSFATTTRTSTWRSSAG